MELNTREYSDEKYFLLHMMVKDLLGIFKQKEMPKHSFQNIFKAIPIASLEELMKEFQAKYNQ